MVCARSAKFQYEVNAILIAAGRIKEGQSFRDLDDSTACRYIKRPDLITSKLATITEVVTPEVSNG